MNEALPIWNCTLDAAATSTVGSKFNMKCKGDIAVNWGAETPQVAYAKKEDSFILTVLKADRLSPNEADFTVTSYKAGKHAPEYLRIVQGANGFEVSKPTWEIQSVLKKEKPPEAYPPFGPWSLGFPMWILITVAVVLTVLALLGFRQLRRYSQRKKIREELARHKTALSPIHQFYRDARQLRRRLNDVKNSDEVKVVVGDLDREFRLYVLRQFQIPTLDWSDRAIVDDLRRRHRKIFMAAGDPLKKVLRELSRLKAQNEVKQNDVEQMHRMSMDAAERIETAVDQRGGRR